MNIDYERMAEENEYLKQAPYLEGIMEDGSYTHVLKCFEVATKTESRLIASACFAPAWQAWQAAQACCGSFAHAAC